MQLKNVTEKVSPDNAGPRTMVSVAPAIDGETEQVFVAVARHFALLAEPTRLKIMHVICHNERSVSAIVAATGATQTNVSRHLSMLRQAGVVSRRRDGNVVYYKVIDPEFVTVCRGVCAQIAGRIGVQKSLQDELLQFAAAH